MTEAIAEDCCSDELKGLFAEWIEFRNDADKSKELAACEIIYKDKRFAQITELAMCSGFDVTVNTTDGGKNVTYTEIRAAQCCSFAGCDYTLMYQNENITLNFSVGNTLPYLV
jgi:hypothetical protein